MMSFPRLKLLNDENKLSDQDVIVRTSTLPELSIASEEEEIPLIDVCDHATDTLFKLSTIHSDGKSLRKWVQYQNMNSIGQFVNGMKDNWQ